MVICTVGGKSNYHTIMTTMAPSSHQSTRYRSFTVFGICLVNGTHGPIC